jgi:hypothetical protein
MKEQPENSEVYTYLPEKQISLIGRIWYGPGMGFLVFIFMLFYLHNKNSEYKIDHFYLFYLCFTLFFILLIYLYMLRQKKLITKIVIDNINKIISISYTKFVVVNNIVMIDFNKFSFRCVRTFFGKRALKSLGFFSNKKFVGFLIVNNIEYWPCETISEIYEKLRELKLKEKY